MKVELDYFKPTGKWYAKGEYITNQDFIWNIIKEIEIMKENKKLPGINGNEYFIHIKMNGNSGYEVNHLITLEKGGNEYEG